MWDPEGIELVRHKQKHQTSHCAVKHYLYTFVFYNVYFRCDSPEKLKAILPRLEQELKDTGKFKDFYQFTFNFAKNPGQKGLGKHKNNTFRT